MKRLFTLITFITLLSFVANAQPWDVELTIIDPGNGYENIIVKGSMDSWTDNAMVSDANPNPTTWTYTYSIAAAGDFDWGAKADGIDWLLDAPYGIHEGNLSFSVDASGTVTGETSFTLYDQSTPLTEIATFYVDMNALITSGAYVVGDDVEVRGSFNSWSGDVLTDDDDDGVYSLTTGVVLAEGSEIAFKFVHTTGGDNWEDGLSGNRSYIVLAGTNNYCAVFDTEGSDCTTAVKDIKNISISISPNPSTGIFQLSSKTNFEVVDLTGKLVLTGNSNTINLTGFTSGMYIVKLSALEGISLQKLIVK